MHIYNEFEMFRIKTSFGGGCLSRGFLRDWAGERAGEIKDFSGIGLGRGQGQKSTNRALLVFPQLVVL